MRQENAQNQTIQASEKQQEAQMETVKEESEKGKKKIQKTEDSIPSKKSLKVKE